MNKDHYCAAPMSEAEIQDYIMEGWTCPLCGTRGHLAAFNYKVGYCTEKGLIVDISLNGSKKNGK